MSKDELLAFFRSACDRIISTTEIKNNDYTGGSADPFANFTQSEYVAGVSTEQGFLVRMGDKMARIKSFTQLGVLKVADESVEDSLLDLAGYALLLAAYIKGKRNAVCRN